MTRFQKLHKLTTASVCAIALAFSTGGIATAATPMGPVSTGALVPSYPSQLSGADEHQIAAMVTNATPHELQLANTEAVAKQEGFESNGSVDVEIPSDSTDPVILTSDEGDKLEVQFDPSVEAQGSLVADGSVVYQQDNQVAQTAQPTDDGVRINTVITNSGAPEEYRHEIKLPDGVRMVTGAQLEELTPEEFRTEPSHGIFFLDEADQLVGGISAPWAVDAAGNSVPTHYAIDGSTVIQYVEHKAGTYTYPIVADPWLGFSLISSAKWIKRSQGRTLSVKPTAWARANAPGYLVGVAGWNELYSKYQKKGLKKNLGGMKDQYICHQQFAFFKSSWNLDEWRPDVSYARTVATMCNP